MSFLYKNVVTFPSLTGIPEDASQNTFYFEDTSTSVFSSGISDLLASDLEDFYNVVQAGSGENIAKFLSHTRSRAADAVTIETYGHTSPYSPTMLWGSPLDVHTFTLGAVAAGTTPYPAEVAIVLSFHADLSGILEESGATRPRARRRGRIYLGPMNTGCGNIVAGTNQLIVHANAVATICEAAAALEVASAGSGAAWSVYSGTAGDAFEVEAGWVDNAFDTQRRRGEQPTIRTTWS